MRYIIKSQHIHIPHNCDWVFPILLWLNPHEPKVVFRMLNHPTTDGEQCVFFAFGHLEGKLPVSISRGCVQWRPKL